MMPALPLIGLASAAIWAVLGFVVLELGFPAAVTAIGLVALALLALAGARR